MQKILREYKKVEPLQTVQRIRGILMDLGLGVYENHWRNIGGKIFSCVVNLEGLNDLVAYGKGINRQYALASAYGEIIERVQNLKIFFTKVGISDQEVLSAFNDVVVFESIPDLFEANKNSSLPGIIRLSQDLEIPENRPVLGAEFFDVQNKRTVILPYLSMLDSSGSNGMCAGNDPAEALVQGLCEVFERETLKQIFSDTVILPNISDSHIRETSCCDMIKALDNLNITVTVKDCSLGRDFPVVGVLLVNRNTGRYSFKLGAHPIFDFALERALNEAYQGTGEWDLPTLGEEVVFSGDSFGNNEKDLSQKEKNLIRCINFLGQLRTGSKRVPNTIFSDKPTYSFKKWNFFAESSSYEEDLSYFKELLDRNNLSLFIRDVSFLGFPSYYIFITGYSSVFDHWPWKIKSRKETINSFQERRQSRRELSEIYVQLDGADKEGLLDLSEYIELNFSSIESDIRDRRLWLEMIFNYHVPEEKMVLPEYLLALLYSKLENYKKAFWAMEKAIDRHEIKRNDNEYYHIFRDALYFLQTSQSLGRIRPLLSMYYNEKGIDSIMKGLESRDELFKNIPVPVYSEYKDYPKLKRVYGKIKHKVQRRRIDQNEIAYLFRSA